MFTPGVKRLSSLCTARAPITVPTATGLSQLLALLVTGLLLTAQAQAQLAPVPVQSSSIAIELPAVDKTNLAVARQLVKAGGLNLALDFLQRHPPSVGSADVLEAWAEQKWSILILLGDWYTLKSDAHGLPASFGASQYFAIPYEARAMIELGELDAARRLLQPALLNKQLPQSIQRAIREQLITLYRAQGDYANAKIEAIRFHDEFKPQDTDWFVSRAVIEYLSGDPASASQLLAPIASIEAKLLQTLFRLEANEIDAAAAQLQLHRQLGRKRISDAEKKLAYALKAKTSDRHEESTLGNRISALEHYLVNVAGDLHPDVVTFGPEVLKQAYLDLSDLLINDALINPGRSSLKFTLAQQADQNDLPAKARALYADVMLDENDSTLGLVAKDLFVKGFLQSEQQELLSQLLGHQGVMGNFEHIDGSTSAAILNYALEQGDADLISAIAPGLGAAPESVNPRDWILQKARVDIFAGRFRQAQDKLKQWLSEGDTLSGEQVDRVLQAVFDLQSVQQNKIALDLLEKISQQTNSKRHKREILFWKAQSYDEMKQRLVAAEHYLRSAMIEANGYDQWGQSARYHAAITLMEAGAYFDARRLFEALMSVANDPSRRATIKQSLQRLWLLEHNLGN